MMRVVLPYHLQQLAHTGRLVELEVESPVTQRRLLDALEARYPMLKGTIRDPLDGSRRKFLRYFACGEDLSLEDSDTLLPEAVVRGEEEFMIVGAMAGG